MLSAPRAIPHGTASGYVAHGCRCAPCREAEVQRQREWRQRHREGKVKHKPTHPCCVPVRIRGTVYPSMSIAAAALKVCPSTISRQLARQGSADGAGLGGQAPRRRVIPANSRRCQIHGREFASTRSIRCVIGGVSADLITAPLAAIGADASGILDQGRTDPATDCAGAGSAVRSTADLGFAMPVVAADGSRIAVGTNDLGVLIFDPHRPLDQSGDPVATVPLDRLAWTLAAASKATVFAAGSQGGEVVVADFLGRELARFAPVSPNYPRQGIVSLAVSTDGGKVYAGDESGTICALTVATGDRDCFRQTGLSIQSLTLFDGDRFLAAAEKGARLTIFDTMDNAHLYMIELTDNGGVVTDVRLDIRTEFGSRRCIETRGLEWRLCP